jgi:hypothetical protein
VFHRHGGHGRHASVFCLLATGFHRLTVTGLALAIPASATTTAATTTVFTLTIGPAVLVAFGLGRCVGIRAAICIQLGRLTFFTLTTATAATTTTATIAAFTFGARLIWRCCQAGLLASFSALTQSSSLC